MIGLGDDTTPVIPPLVETFDVVPTGSGDSASLIPTGGTAAGIISQPAGGISSGLVLVGAGLAFFLLLVSIGGRRR